MLLTVIGACQYRMGKKRNFHDQFWSTYWREVEVLHEHCNCLPTHEKDAFHLQLRDQGVDETVLDPVALAERVEVGRTHGLEIARFGLHARVLDE